MKNHLLFIEKIKKLAGIKEENFHQATRGTRHNVFISDRYVIRFRDDDNNILLREADLLKTIDNPIIPKVVWTGDVDGVAVMIEARLSGENLDLMWGKISQNDQINLVEQVVNFLLHLKTQTKNDVYSINTGKKYSSFIEYLTDGIQEKISSIEKFKQTEMILKELMSIIEDIEGMNLFRNKDKSILVHGDLIIHNILTDGRNLTGVLDWELALYGDPDYDLCRLFYYQECAKAYQEQWVDETFESYYMDKLMNAILESSLIKDTELFKKKYYFMRAIFYLNALYWSINSSDPEKNISELIGNWNQKTGLSI